jgi:hypothetical protein
MPRERKRDNPRAPPGPQACLEKAGEGILPNQMRRAARRVPEQVRPPSHAERRETFMNGHVTRRTAFLAGLASIMGAVAPVRTLAQGRGPVSEVKVDVGPLRSTGANDVADWVNQALPGALRDALSRQWAASGGRTVVAQINTVQIGVSRVMGPARSNGGMRSRSQDSMDGNVTLLDASGREIARSHILATRPSPANNTATTAAMRQQQVANLCISFAHWTPRRLGL